MAAPSDLWYRQCTGCGGDRDEDCECGCGGDEWAWVIRSSCVGGAVKVPFGTPRPHAPHWCTACHQRSEAAPGCCRQCGRWRCRACLHPRFVRGFPYGLEPQDVCVACDAAVATHTPRVSVVCIYVSPCEQLGWAQLADAVDRTAARFMAHPPRYAVRVVDALPRHVAWARGRHVQSGTAFVAVVRETQAGGAGIAPATEVLWDKQCYGDAGVDRAAFALLRALLAVRQPAAVDGVVTGVRQLPPPPPPPRAPPTDATAPSYPPPLPLPPRTAAAQGVAADLVENYCCAGRPPPRADAYVHDRNEGTGVQGGGGAALPALQAAPGVSTHAAPPGAREAADTADTPPPSASGVVALPSASALRTVWERALAAGAARGLSELTDVLRGCAHALLDAGLEGFAARARTASDGLYPPPPTPTPRPVCRHENRRPELPAGMTPAGAPLPAVVCSECEALFQPLSPVVEYVVRYSAGHTPSAARAMLLEVALRHRFRTAGVPCSTRRIPIVGVACPECRTLQPHPAPTLGASLLGSLGFSDTPAGCVACGACPTPIHLDFDVDALAAPLGIAGGKGAGGDGLSNMVPRLRWLPAPMYIAVARTAAAASAVGEHVVAAAAVGARARDTAWRATLEDADEVAARWREAYRIAVHGHAAFCNGQCRGACAVARPASVSDAHEGVPHARDDANFG